MHEVDFLPVGDEGASGDAIAIRFSKPSGGYAVVVIDAGFKDDGVALSQHIPRWYDTNYVDLAILTHPDGDHIGGMGELVQRLDVGMLCLHRIGDRGGRSLPAADVVDELIDLAEGKGTSVVEAFAGESTFEEALTILGPDEDWYEELVDEQVNESAARSSGRWMTKSYMRVTDRRSAAYIPEEIPFGDEGGTNPRNNSSMITMVQVEDRTMLFPGDAGVPALERALRQYESVHGSWTAPDFVQIPHAGSRHNASSEFLDTILGPKGQNQERSAFVSVASKAVKHPSPRVVNAYMRRGYRVCETRGTSIRHKSADAPNRGWSPLTPLSPMDESVED